MLNYEWIVQVGVFPCDWQSQADEWIHRVEQEMTRRQGGIRITRRRIDAETAPFMQATLQRGDVELNTVLLVGASNSDVYVFMAGPQAADKQLVDELTTAIQEASGKLGSEGEEHEWSAIIGPTHERVGGTEKRISGAVTLGRFRIESADSVFVEPDTSHQRSLSGWAIQKSVPIRVYGTSRGYSWESASVRAARDLHTVCGILTMALEMPTMVREAAAPVEWGIRQVPPHPPWYTGIRGEVPILDVREIPEVDLPDWVDGAWERVQESPRLLGALDAFLEGSLMAARHPSLAAVSFTATIETIATRIYKLEICEGCRERRGLSKAFKASLRLVTDEETASLLDGVYSARSKTVHAGRFHGDETTPGVHLHGIYGTNPQMDFRWRTLYGLEHAAKKLLLWALMNEIPPRKPLPA